MAATTITITVAGIQRWIVGGFTKLQLIRGGSELLKAVFEDLARFASEQGWEIVTTTSGTLSVTASDENTTVGSRLGEELRAHLPLVPAAIRYAFEDGTSRVERLAPVGTPPAVAVCAYSGDSGASEEDGDGQLRSAEIRQRINAIASILDTPSLSFEMTDIGALTTGRFGGYVGIVVADGDGIGRRVDEAWTKGRSAVRDLNRRLKKESTALIDAALAAGEREMGSDFLWNPIITGGDDITLVVPARTAPAVALALSSQPDVDGQSGMAASVAVFICKSSYPFHLARATAEGILHDVKKLARPQGEPMIGIRFEPGSIAALSRWVFEQGPYTRSQFEAMSRWAASKPAISASSLRHLAVSAETGGRAAIREWHIATAPSPGSDDPTGLRTVLAEFGGDHSPFDDDGRSPIGDLIDMRSLAERSVS